MKVRHQKKKINALKCVDRNGDVVPLLKYFKGLSYYGLVVYFEELINSGYIAVRLEGESVCLSDKGRAFLSKTCPRYVPKPI